MRCSKTRPQVWGARVGSAMACAFACGCDSEDAGAPPETPEDVSYLEPCVPQPGHQPVSVSGGENNIVIRMSDGVSYCIGSNGNGQCDPGAYFQFYANPRRAL